MILDKYQLTDEKDADFAIFFVPVIGILARLSINALELVSLIFVTEVLPL
jgi:hypothetical protein